MAQQFSAEESPRIVDSTILPILPKAMLTKILLRTHPGSATPGLPYKRFLSLPNLK